LQLNLSPEPVASDRIGFVTDRADSTPDSTGPARQSLPMDALPDHPESLNDAALLALLLGGRSAVARQRAAQWLSRAGSLQRLAACERQILQALPGFGPARALRLRAALELGRRCLERSAPLREPLRNPEEAAVCFRARLADLPHEAFACVFLDTRHRIICFEILFRGTLDGAPIYPREVLKRALHHNAAAVIAGHNHPSGDCEPSQADRTITRRLQKSLALVDIRLLDHLIVGRGCSRSLATLGWL
jgi:DNA repair protein RadC